MLQNFCSCQTCLVWRYASDSWAKQLPVDANWDLGPATREEIRRACAVQRPARPDRLPTKRLTIFTRTQLDQLKRCFYASGAQIVLLTTIETSTLVQITGQRAA